MEASWDFCESTSPKRGSAHHQKQLADPNEEPELRSTFHLSGVGGADALNPPHSGTWVIPNRVLGSRGVVAYSFYLRV